MQSFLILSYFLEIIFYHVVQPTKSYGATKVHKKKKKHKMNFIIRRILADCQSLLKHQII